jgi:hypothetical protein
MLRTTIVLPIAISAAVLAQPAGLTDAEVEAAIAAAKQSGYKSLFAQARGRFAAGFSIIVQGPVGRTMDLAREAFDSYKPITPKDVPAEVRAHAVTFTVLKHGVTKNIKNVVVMPAGATSRDAAIQPIAAAAKDARPRTWKPNFVSQDESGPSVYYRFAAASLPPGEFQIVIATDAGDERYTIRAQDRSGIR